MIYILLDNYDEGLECDEVKTFDDLAEYLRKVKESEGGYSRIQTLIFGEEIPWDVVRTYYNLKE